MKKIISTDKAPAAIGPYSQGMIIGNLAYTSGQLPIDPATGEMPESIEEQATQSLKNVAAVLEAGGSSLANTIKVTVFLSDMEDFSAVNKVYGSFFESGYPCRSAVEVARLPKDAKIEIEAVAMI